MPQGAPSFSSSSSESDVWSCRACLGFVCALEWFQVGIIWEVWQELEGASWELEDQGGGGVGELAFLMVFSPGLCSMSEVPGSGYIIMIYSRYHDLTFQSDSCFITSCSLLGQNHIGLVVIIVLWFWDSLAAIFTLVASFQWRTLSTLNNFNFVTFLIVKMSCLLHYVVQSFHNPFIIGNSLK